jgi:hypothetical protein
MTVHGQLCGLTGCAWFGKARNIQYNRTASLRATATLAMRAPRRCFSRR